LRPALPFKSPLVKARAALPKSLHPKQCSLTAHDSNETPARMATDDPNCRPPTTAGFFRVDLTMISGSIFSGRFPVHLCIVIATIQYPKKFNPKSESF
jgi:hypothetical protein